jgi:hypothetical protein
MTAAEVAQEELRDFVRISARLTGFSEFDLWGTGQAEAYFDTVREQLPEHGGPGAVVSALNSDLASPVASSVIKLWYVGVWYGPELNGREDVAAWTAPGRSGAKPAVPGGSESAESQPWQNVPRQYTPGADGTGKRKPPFVVSPTAYTEGLLWRAIGAQPSGAKAPGYGSWAEPPAIEDVIERAIQ